MSKHAKHYAPRCCGKVMRSVWDRAGKIGRNGGERTSFRYCICETCGRKL